MIGFLVFRCGVGFLLRRSARRRDFVVLTPPGFEVGGLENLGTVAGELFEAEGGLLDDIEVGVVLDHLNEGVANGGGAAQTKKIGGFEPNLPGMGGIADELDELFVVELGVAESGGFRKVIDDSDVVTFEA